MNKGKFIVIDGGDGAGKSSQLKKLKDFFGEQVVVTREPGGSPYAEEIRHLILKSPNAGQADAKTLFALFWAGRRDHIKNTILPALNAGKHVICDRFDSSTFAYQIFGQEARELEEMFFIFRDFFLGDCKPDAYIYLDVDIVVGLSRKNNTGVDKNHLDEKERDFFYRMQNGYNAFFERVAASRVDANLSMEHVFENLLAEIKKVVHN